MIDISGIILSILVTTTLTADVHSKIKTLIPPSKTLFLSKYFLNMIRMVAFVPERTP